jgi:hypothetical protein
MTLKDEAKGDLVDGNVKKKMIVLHAASAEGFVVGTQLI